MKYIPGDEPTLFGVVVSEKGDSVDDLIAEHNRRRAEVVESRDRADRYTPPQPEVTKLRHAGNSRPRPWPKPRPGDGTVRHDAATQRAIDACAAHGLHFWAFAPGAGHCWAVSDDQRWYRVVVGKSTMWEVCADGSAAPSRERVDA